MLPLLSGILAEAILIYLLNNIDLFLLFAHDYLTKIYGSLSFIFLLYTAIRPKVRVLIELFLYVHMTIRPKYMHMVLFHLFFLQRITTRPKIRVLIDLFPLFAHGHSTKLYGPLSSIFSLVHDHSIKTWVLINLFILFVLDHSTKTQVPC